MPAKTAEELRKAAMTDADIRRRRAARLKDMGVVQASLKNADVIGGVSVGWLAEIFRMDPTTVRRKLADCPPIGATKAGNRYSLPQACAYLVKPVFDVKKYIMNMKPEDMPAHLNAQYWRAMRDRQIWEENAKELWRTTDVMDAFSEAFLTIKSTTQLWTEDVERAVGLSAEQRKTIIALTDALLNEIKEKLVTNHVGKDKPPSVAQHVDNTELPIPLAPEPDYI